MLSLNTKLSVSAINLANMEKSWTSNILILEN